MKSIAELYLAYLERALISMVLASLAFISISGIVYGRSARIPAALAVVTLGLIFYVELGRRGVLKVHPEFERNGLREIRLFSYLVERKAVQISNALHFTSRGVQQNLSRIAGTLIVVLIVSTLWSSFHISADITLRKNQVIVEAGPRVPASIFNSALVIEVLQISAEGGVHRVTALIHSAGYPDLKIEGERVDYQTTYAAGDRRFIVRITEIGDFSAKFFVERLTD